CNEPNAFHRTDQHQNSLDYTQGRMSAKGSCVDALWQELSTCGYAASSPKRLHFSEIRIGFRSHGHRGPDACVLESGQKAGGERAARVRTLPANTYCRDSLFVHSDVVKVAEPILQATESVKKLFAPLHRPPPREQASEELRRVAQLLG